MMKFKFMRNSILALLLINSSVVPSVSARSHHHHEEVRFRVSDFTGKYAVDLNSNGGISGSTGLSISGAGQITLNEDGTGVFNYFSVLVYSGPIGNPATSVIRTNVPFTWTVQDANIGLIYININNQQGQPLILELVGVKSKNKVQSLFGHVLNNPQAAFAGTVTLTRQFN